MSRTLVEMHGLVPAKVHTAKLDLPRVELRLEITDPRTGAARVLPPGPMVSLVDGASATIDEAKVAEGGRASLLGSSSSTDVGIEIDFKDHEWLDLEAAAYVPEADVQVNDVRPLLRLPKKWRSRSQASFSDDRSGAFSGGTLASLEDGKLGSDSEPWVLGLDHGWRRFLLELRYSNTASGGQSALPPGPVVKAAYDAGAPKFRLAGASTVLDGNGLVALWLFDSSVELDDLRVVMLCADDTYIEMEAGALKTVSRAKHRAMLPKARARLHALPSFLRLHEQAAEQASHRGPLATILPVVSQAPAEVLVPIDMLVELRLVLHDPVAGAAVPIPPGVEVLLTDHKNRAVVSADTDADGRVTLFVPPASREVGIEIDFAEAPYLDLVAAGFVAKAEAEPNVKLRLIRLPDRWRSIDQSELSDDRDGLVVSGRLQDLEKGEFGTPDSPWEIDIGHAWQRTELVFQYYDVTALDVRPVVFGPLIEAFDDTRMRERDLVAASTILDEQGRTHLMFFRSVEPQKLQIRLRTELDTVAVTTETDPELRVQRVAEAGLRAMPVADRQRRYPLPSLWLSRGQNCRSEEATSAGGTLFEDAIEGALDTDVLPPRLHFDLDDFVLVNASEVPIGFARDLDLTIFHHDMSIRAPRTGTHQAYFSDIAAGLNHFAGNRAYYTRGVGAAQTTRVIRRGMKFYDLKRERTHRGRLIGVRAAVAGDHPHERIFLKQEPGTGPNLSNCDMHYFEDVASDPAVPGRSISVLLVFFSVRIRRLVKDPHDTELNNLQDALGRAAERWSGGSLENVLAGATPKTPDVRLRTDDGAHDLKFAFHFPAFDDREGHAAMWLHGQDFAFSLATAGIIMVGKGDSKAGWRGGSPQTGIEHGLSFANETVAHELGHAMGLGDEYFTNFRHTSAIPRLKQHTWNFLHFSFDDHSLMNDEYAPRLRHYWVFSRWLEHSTKVPRVMQDGYALTCDTSVLSSPTRGRAHQFRLPPAHPWPYDATREDREFRPGHAGRGKLRLYLLGDDFDVHNLSSPSPLSGIDAVLYWDIAVYFRRRRSADGNKSATSMRGYVDRVFEEMVRSIGAVRTSTATAASVARCLVLELDVSAPAQDIARKHAQKVLLYVLPRFTTSNPAAADFRVHMRPRSSKPGADVTDLHDSAFRGRKIAVHEDVPGPALLRYMMGFGPSEARPGAKIEISTTPLSTGGSFSIGSSSVGSRSLNVVHGPRTPGADDYDGSGTPEQVAAELAEAINDSKNRFASHIRATATGREVALESVPPGADIKVHSARPGTSVRDDWSGDFEPSELGFLSDWLGEQLGATYRIRLYV